MTYNFQDGSPVFQLQASFCIDTESGKALLAKHLIFRLVSWQVHTASTLTLDSFATTIKLQTAGNVIFQREKILDQIDNTRV